MNIDLIIEIIAGVIILLTGGTVGGVVYKNRANGGSIEKSEESLEEKIDKMGYSLGSSIDTVRDSVNKMSDKVECLAQDQKNTKKNMLEITLKQRLDANDRDGFYRTWEEFKQEDYSCQFIQDQLNLKNQKGWA